MKEGPSKVSMSIMHLLRRKRANAILALTLTVVVAGVIAALPQYIRPVHAAGATLTVPTTYHYSNSIDAPPIKVVGANYGANETVKIYWNCTSSCTGTPVTTATTNATGSFTAYFFPPLVASATYPITGVGQTSGSTATASLLLLPQLYTFPRGAGPGSPITVYGNAFGAGEDVNVYWNYKKTNPGKLLVVAVADTNGVFDANTNFPTNITPGYYYIGAVGQTSRLVMKFRVLIYSPMLALAPLSGSADTTLTVSALGLAGLENVNIFWNNSASPTTSAVANAFGQLPPTTFTVPAGVAPGTYPVKIVGQISLLTIMNNYTLVAPGSSLGMVSGPVGTSIDVIGQGYAPDETVNVLWNYTGPGTGTSVASISAGSSGTVDGNFTIPSMANGTYTVAVVGTNSQSITQNTFTVGNGLSASPGTNAPGTNVTITGTGFQKNETVNLYWDSTSSIPLATTVANANGNISQSVILPSSATPGSHSTIGVGQISGKTFTTPVTIDTQWGDFGFDVAHTRENPHENLISVQNAGGLTKKWAVPISTPTLAEESSPVYADGTVFIPSSDGTLKAFNATTGALKWQSNTHTGFLSYASALVSPDAGMVFFGTCMDLPGPFYGIDMNTGAVKWSLILAGSQYNFPTLAFHNIYIGISKDGGLPTPTHDTALLAIDQLSGHINWQHSTNGGVWGAVGVDATTKTVFTGIGDPDNAVMAANALTGALIWQTPIPNSVGNADVGSSITVANGLVYADSKNGSEYALNESNGTVTWAAKLGTPTGNLSSQAVSVNGTLYVGSLNRNFYALNATTGALRWKYGSNGFIFSSPAMANGVVYFADTDMNIYALDANTGKNLWNYTTGNKSYSSPIVVNGWLYCASSDGYLYAFSL